MNTAIGFTKFNDEKLYDSVKKLGTLLLRGRNIFLVMLPEVNRRKLFLKKGFESIFHFAKMTGGVSEKHVRRVLNVEERFEYLPIMKKLLLSGKVPVSKLARVVSVVTQENQEYWVNQVQLLSARALETLVRDYKLTIAIDQNQEQNALFEPQSETKSVHVHTFEFSNKTTFSQQITAPIIIIPSPELSDEVKLRLNELQTKKIDINDIITQALDRREQEIARDKATQAKKTTEAIDEGKTTRPAYPAATKRLLKKEYGEKCAVETCNKRAQEIHHTARFSASHSHNPYFLAPLCKEHHQIAHAADVKANEIRIQNYNSAA